MTFEEPIQVTLSDSVIRVNASITNQASQKYAKKNRKKLTEGTVGGLISLLEFEIVATHFGPRDKRLTLYVKDFKSIGSEGSGNFGVAPQAIESREGTKQLLHELQCLRENGPDAHSKQSATASPIRSQHSAQDSEAGETQDSQVGFATQVPRSNAPAVSGPKPPHSTTSINIGSNSTANSVKSLASSMKGKQRSPSAGTLSPIQVQAAPQRPSLNDEKTLLGLLQYHKRAPPASAVISEPITGQPPGRSATLIAPALIERGIETSRDILLAPDDDNVSRAPVGTQKRKRQSPSNTPRKKVADGDELNGIDTTPESLTVNHEPGKKAASNAAVTEASMNTLRSRPATPSISASPNVQMNAPLPLSYHSASKCRSSASGQKSGRNRISSRDVTIPKDQEALLNRADCKLFQVNLIPLYMSNQSSSLAAGRAWSARAHYKHTDLYTQNAKSESGPSCPTANDYRGAKEWYNEPRCGN